MIAKVILILVFAHFLLDWSLQDSMTKKYKCESNFVLVVHCIIWSLGISIVLMFLGLFAWWKVIMLLVGHYCMDYWKCRGLYKKLWRRPTQYELGDKVVYKNQTYVCNDKNKIQLISDMQSLYIDQSFHIIQILLCLL